jgi:hypothetical protein
MLYQVKPAQVYKCPGLAQVSPAIIGPLLRREYYHSWPAKQSGSSHVTKKTEPASDNHVDNLEKRR